MISFKNRLWRLSVLSFAAFAVVVSAAACAGDDDDDDTDATTGPTTSATATAGASASATAPAAVYPMKVKDMLGREVEIKSKPTTIVAVSPTAVELVYAAGGKVVGRTTTATFPEEAKSAKEIGTAYQPNLEQILALKPDLVVADSSIHAQPALRKPLEELPVPVIFAGAESYQQVLDGLKLMGQVLDNKAAADTVIAGIEKAKEDAKKALAGKKVTALALIADRDNTLYAAKPSSYAGDILAQLGIENPAAAQADSGPFPGYTTLSAEKLVQFNPDFIFAITPAPEPAPRLASLIPTIPPFKSLKAVTGNDVVDAKVDYFVQAPGPRIVEAFKTVAAAVSAP